MPMAPREPNSCSNLARGANAAALAPGVSLASNGSLDQVDLIVRFRLSHQFDFSRKSMDDGSHFSRLVVNLSQLPDDKDQPLSCRLGWAMGRISIS